MLLGDMRRLRCLALLLVLFAADASCAADDPLAKAAGNDLLNDVSDASAGSMRLRLKNNAFGVGRIVPSPQANKIGWQNEGFVEPFFFDAASIRAISTIQANQVEPKADKNQFMVEAVDGQCIVGAIQQIDERSVMVDSQILGSVKVDAKLVNQIVRADYSGEVIYPGLSKQTVWNRIGNSSDWEFRAGALTAVKQAAAIIGEVDLPSKCEVIIAMSWKGVPDFVVSIGAGRGEKSNGQVSSTARLEIWNRNLVLVRETEKDADLAKLLELSEKNPQVELNILLDQESGLVVVRDMHGRKLGKTQVVDNKKRLGTAIHIVNHGPSMSIERLEVRAWNGNSMLGEEQLRQMVLRDGQASEDNWISGVDNEKGQFTVENSAGAKSSVAIADVVLAGLKHSVDAKLNQISNLANDANSESGGTGNVEVILSDRTRIKGQLLPSNSGKLGFRSSWSASDLTFPAEQVVNLVGSDQRFSPDLTSHRNGILKIGDTEFAGYLEENVSEAGSSALRWHPHGSDTASAMAANAEGSVAYRLQLPMAADGQPTGRVEELVVQQKEAPSKEQPSGDAVRSTREMVFISGDTIDGYVEKIDDKGVTFVSEQTTVRFAEHSRFDRVWLNSLAGSVKKTASEKIQRLMTVPRSMKDDPPTHLLLAVTGDLLRGRLISLDDKTAHFEVRNESAEIPRQQIAEIVWLHERKWDVDSKPKLVAADRYQIHVVQQNRGLTFGPLKVTDGILHGESSLLGAYQVNIKQVSQILFGPNIDQRVNQFRENPWVLSLAQLPRAFSEDAEATLTPLGVSSPLIGKPAPAFKVELLDGKRVQLGDFLGKTLVIDFWASWCGPCMKSLPAVSQVVEGFEPDEVTLMAINIQETEGRVDAALKRLDINAIVGLDHDGEIAASYQATSIPQTVVIDKTGTVRFVFVGTRNNLVAELKDAIDQCRQ